jgi:hypothetical protein
MDNAVAQMLDVEWFEKAGATGFAATTSQQKIIAWSLETLYDLTHVNAIARRYALPINVDAVPPRFGPWVGGLLSGNFVLELSHAVTFMSVAKGLADLQVFAV